MMDFQCRTYFIHTYSCFKHPNCIKLLCNFFIPHKITCCVQILGRSSCGNFRCRKILFLTPNHTDKEIRCQMQAFLTPDHNHLPIRPSSIKQQFHRAPLHSRQLLHPAPQHSQLNFPPSPTTLQQLLQRATRHPGHFFLQQAPYSPLKTSAPSCTSTRMLPPAATLPLMMPVASSLMSSFCSNLFIGRAP